jgi:hypothetical protein
MSMADCITENVCEVDIASEGCDRISDFDNAVNYSERFKIEGLTDDSKNFVLRDAKYAEDSELSCVLVPVLEVINKPLVDVMGVLNGTRPDITCKGYTRIVGYYSSLKAWSKSKIGEARTRASGDYGIPGYQKQHQAERLQYIDNMGSL